MGRQFAEIAAGVQHQRVDVREFAMTQLLLSGNETEHLVDPLQALEISAEIIQEDAGQCVTRHLRKRRVAGRPRSRRSLAPELSHRDDQDALRAQVQRRREWRNLPHRSIGIVIVA